TVGPLASRAAAIMGSAAFLLPETVTTPCRRAPPLTTNLCGMSFPVEQLPGHPGQCSIGRTDVAGAGYSGCHAPDDSKRRRSDSGFCSACHTARIANDSESTLYTMP